jgi:hypothetical protein
MNRRTLTIDFIAAKILIKAPNLSVETARKYSTTLYETALFYFHRDGEQSFNTAIEINCRLCGSNVKELNEFIKNKSKI